MSLPILHPTLELDDYLFTIAEQADEQSMQYVHSAPDVFEVLRWFAQTYYDASAHVAHARLASLGMRLRRPLV